MNLIAVKVFGEAEFWFSMIKITLIVGLIVTAVVMLFLGFQLPSHAYRRRGRHGLRRHREPDEHHRRLPARAERLDELLA